MFRTEQQNMAVNNENIMNQVEFLSKLSAIPSVNLAVAFALDSYTKTKERNFMLNYTLGTAEKTISAAIHTVEPIVNKFQTPVKYVDGIACKGLDKLEENMPFIKQTPNQMIENTKSYYHGKIEQSKTKYNNVKDSGTEKVLSAANAILETSYGKYVAQKVDNSLIFSDQYIDSILPANDVEVENEENDAMNTAERAAKLSNKVYRRLSKKAYHQVDVVQSRARDALAQLNIAFTVIDQVKQNVAATNERLNQSYQAVQTQFHDMYEQLLKEDTENFSDKKNLNDRIFYITRQLTQKLVSSLNTAVETSQNVPVMINERIQQSQTYATEMYSYFLKTTKIDELNNQVFETFKPKVQYIQESLQVLANYPMMNFALQYLKVNKNCELDNTQDDVMEAEPSNDENVSDDASN